MRPFVRDMHLHVHTAEGKTSVEAPADVKAGKFLDDLREPLHLQSKDAEGRRIHWHIYDPADRKLDPNKTLGENGVGEGHDLYFRAESEGVPVAAREEEERAHPRREPKHEEKHKEEDRVLIRCDNGHFFDPKKHATCPYCDVPGSDTATTPKKKEPVVAALENVGATRPAGGFSQVSDPGQSGDLTIRVGMGETRIDPVVGWVVCIHGPEKGKDYRIRSETNTIGRSDEMFIAIKDDMISRERHAFITFDPQTNRFYIRPGDARGLVHRNGNVVFQAEELHAYDEILMGQSKLVFVPLCGEHFKWE
jgi:hypothetical protein